MAVRIAKTCAVLMAASASGAAVTHDRAAASVTPLQKVVEMLGGMLATGKSEKNVEETEFATFQQWCDSTQTASKRSIDEGAAQIEQLTADILKSEADAETLGAEAADLLAEADAMQVELDNETSVRKTEKADYDAMHADFSESVDAVERAIATLKSRGADVKQSLIQLRSIRHIPQDMQDSIESLLSTKQAPEANAYESQSGGVVKMLEKLRLKFQDERLALQKAELASKGNYEVLKQRLTDNIKENQKVASKKQAVKAQRLEDAAVAKGDLEVTETTKAEDEKTLADTLTRCSARSEEYEKNQVVRSEEIKAIEKAVEILNSESVKGNAETYLPSLAQATGVSLTQLRGVDATADARKKAAALLQSRAAQLGSRYLSLAASRMEADPFVKVKKMVKDLIVKLMEEANSEADHKAYCDTELATNKQTREIKSAEVDELTATTEKLTAESERLSTELTELSDAVSEIMKQQAEALAQRTAEKKSNTQTIADAKAAQLAVESATRILKDFYASAAEASLVQQKASEPYNGMQAESGGIVGFLEVVLSDFARLETETATAEDQAQESYDKYMNESTQNVAVKKTEIEHKEKARMNTDANIASTKKELELTQQELDAALDYYEKLKPDCVNNGLSYEDRVGKREAEIQSLKEALEILGQQDLDA